MNPLSELQAYRQSFWYDNIRRKFLLDSTLQTLIDDDGLRGMTSNPSIFENAIGKSDDYDQQIAALVADGLDMMAIYEALVIDDIRAACDMFSPVFAATNRLDGYVSLEVSPHLANDSQATIADARRLFAAVDRPNLMIKVPATPAGIPAIRQLIGEGININITLMFSQDHYEDVAKAYMSGLLTLLKNGGDLAQVASVASFFVSRVDTAVDKQLSDLADPEANSLLGKAAVANSKAVYQRFKELFHGPTFDSLRTAGASVQRLLWASTSTKNPAYSDTLYVDELIGPETVNTMPPKTIDAFRDHGRLANTLEQDVEQAKKTLLKLGDMGIDLANITEQLQLDGVAAFSRSFDSLLATLEEKIVALSKT